MAADDATAELMKKIGRGLHDGRTRLRLTQQQVADSAAISRAVWSELERGKTQATIWLVNRAAFAVGGNLDAWIKATSVAQQPRDAVHLGNQELVIRTAQRGGWRPLPEEALDHEIRRSRWADVLLERRRPAMPAEYALLEITDWIPDVGETVRDFSRRLDALDRFAVARMVDEQPVPKTGGCWLVRATRRNRELIAAHHNFFRARFPGSGRAWLDALTGQAVPLPNEPALLWLDVKGTRLFAARLGRNAP